MNKQEFNTILSNWDDFCGTIQPIIDKKAKEQGFDAPSVSMHDNGWCQEVNLDIESDHIFFSWQEEEYYCGHSDWHTRNISINKEELEEISSSLPEDPKDRRIKELEQRLYWETNRRRELERNKPTGVMS